MDQRSELVRALIPSCYPAAFIMRCKPALSLRFQQWQASPTLTFQIELRVGHHGCEVDAALVLFPEVDCGRRLVEPDAKTLQLLLDQPLVRHRLEAVQHDVYEVARARRADDL